MTFSLCILFTALQLADVHSTLRFLSNGTGVEVNPVMVKLMKSLGVLPALLLAKAVAIPAVWAAWYYGIWDYKMYSAPIPAVVIAIICAGYTAVVVNNYRISNRSNT